ncbi:hypothetical protein JCM33374_g1980 [Metschnikowia sp. JCM 33374]|nr:hypothetical protein JCM33374_g1980 [Metschnikowia sp. JCM 33374]
MVASDNDQLVVDHVSMPTDGYDIFPEQDNLNYSTGMADTSEINHLGHLHSNSFQQSSEERSVVRPEMVENDVCSNTEDDIRVSTSWDGSALHPITSCGSIDDHSKTSRMVPPHSQETLTQLSMIASDSFQVGSFQDLSMYHTANQSMVMNLPALQSSFTDGSIFVSQNDSPESLANFQKLDPKIYSPQMDLSNTESGPVPHDLPFGESGTTKSTIYAKTSEDAQTAFSRLIPRLQSFIPATFVAFYWR